jgi:thymidylate kinase
MNLLQTEAAMLELCKQFFATLNEQGVRYCHWKSNEHLDKALLGKTDIDLLVDPAHEDRFCEQLKVFDFKEVLSPSDKQFPGLLDYLGMDPDSGRLVHLHVHYRLVLGQKYIKNHWLPVEKLVLDNLETRLGVRVPTPEVELLLLIIRAHMKVDLVSLLKHFVKDLLRQPYTAFPNDIERELRELVQRTDRDAFSNILDQSQLPVPLGFCEHFIDKVERDGLRSFDILAGRYHLLWRLRGYRRSVSAVTQLLYFKQFILNASIARRMMTPPKKTLPGPGRCVSLVGADGAGKSTLIRDLSTWAGWKLETRIYYFGIPKNAIATITSTMRRGVRKLGFDSAARMIADCFWLYVAAYRRNMSRRIDADLRAGKLVITDRFPMKEFRSMPEPMDNPRIDPGRGPLRKWLGQIEQRYYEAILEPDRIIVLKVDLEELRRRKSDLLAETHRLKAEAVNAVAASDSRIVVDAGQPYEKVLLAAKRVVWGAL